MYHGRIAEMFNAPNIDVNNGLAVEIRWTRTVYPVLTGFLKALSIAAFKSPIEYGLCKKYRVALSNYRSLCALHRAR